MGLEKQSKPRDKRNLKILKKEQILEVWGKGLICRDLRNQGLDTGVQGGTSLPASIYKMETQGKAMPDLLNHCKIYENKIK